MLADATGATPSRGGLEMAMAHRQKGEMSGLIQRCPRPGETKEDLKRTVEEDR